MKNRAIISLLAILALVLGVFAYLISNKTLVPADKFGNEINSIEDVSESDEIDDIQEDIDNTEVENIDSEMVEIESEIDAAINNL